MSHDTFRWEQESHAITGTFNENGFGSLTFYPRREKTGV